MDFGGEAFGNFFEQFCIILGNPCARRVCFFVVLTEQGLSAVRGVAFYYKLGLAGLSAICRYGFADRLKCLKVKLGYVFRILRAPLSTPQLCMQPWIPRSYLGWQPPCAPC